MSSDELISLLVRWREWSRTGNKSGFKDRTIEYQLMTAGIVPHGTSTEGEDIDCERLDAAIALMPKKMKKAVKNKYLYGWRNNEAAKKLKIGATAYKEYMKRCRNWLCDKLTE